MKLDIRNKNRWTLVGVEILAIGVLASIWLAQKYSWDLITGIIVGVVIVLTTGLLFFQARLFRYIFTILFSVFWGFLCYTFVDSATNSIATPWVALVLAMLLSLYLHKDYFRFERGY